MAKQKRFKSVTINFKDTENGRDNYFMLLAMSEHDERSLSTTVYRALDQYCENASLSDGELHILGRLKGEYERKNGVVKGESSSIRPFSPEGEDAQASTNL